MESESPTSAEVTIPSEQLTTQPAVEVDRNQTHEQRLANHQVAIATQEKKDRDQIEQVLDKLADKPAPSATIGNENPNTNTEPPQRNNSETSLSPKETALLEQTEQKIEQDLTLCAKSFALAKKFGQPASMMVPIGLGALAMANNTPIPPEIMSRVATAVGGAFFGLSRAPEGAAQKVAYTFGGALVGSAAIEGVSHLNDNKTVQMVANSMDDAPAIAGVAFSFLKKIGDIGKRIGFK